MHEGGSPKTGWLSMDQASDREGSEMNLTLKDVQWPRIRAQVNVHIHLEMEVNKVGVSLPLVNLEI